MNKRVFKKILLLWVVLFVTGLSVKAFAQENDYEFYKKFGHTGKGWNDDVKQGFEAYDQQNCDTALTSLKKAVAAQCQDALVYYKLAVCSELSDSSYTAIQYYQLAQEKLEKMTAIHPYQKEIYENYGRALFKANRYDQAFPLLAKAIVVGTPSFGLYYMVGYLYLKKGDRTTAVDIFNKALALDTTGIPPDLLGGVYREVAKSLIQQKNYGTAMGLLQKATQLNPQDQEAIALRNEASTALQQSSMVNMIQNLSDKNQAGTSAPPPPAAAKLPPLESQPMKDPTPPLGSVQGPGSVAPQGAAPPAAPLPPQPPPQATTNTNPSGVPLKLEPLPPMKP